MKLNKIVELINGKVLCHEEHKDIEILHGFTSDLMSDVLTILENDVILITGLATVQVIRTAEMSDISNVLLVRGKKASPAMLDLAEELDISIITTDFSAYKTSALLYQAGLAPVY